MTRTMIPVASGRDNGSKKKVDHRLIAIVGAEDARRNLQEFSTSQMTSGTDLVGPGVERIPKIAFPTQATDRRGTAVGESDALRTGAGVGARVLAENATSRARKDQTTTREIVTPRQRPPSGAPITTSVRTLQAST